MHKVFKFLYVWFNYHQRIDTKKKNQLELEKIIMISIVLLASSYQRRIFNPSRLNPGQKEKINLSFYFHNSLSCLKRFYKGHKGLHKTFWGATKCESKDLSSFLFQYNFLEFTGRKGLIVSWQHRNLVSVW